MSVYVFLGPSLPVAVAARILPATYLPPVQQGDILRLIDRGADAIGIVDGYFEVVPAVWHKEIMLALEAGIPVFGAASMGALRAAELHPFGMVGVGQIFEWLRDGVIVRDDEVAVVHAPADMNYIALSDAMVDIRDACAAAVRERIMPCRLAEALIAAALAMPFQERSYAAVAQAIGAGPDGSVEGWLHFCRTRGPGLKARDATALLHAIRGAAHAEHRPAAFGKVERTTFLNRLRMEVDLARFGGIAAAAEEAAAPLGVETSGQEMRRGVLLRLLARDAAQRFGWQLRSDEVSEHASALCARLDLPDGRARTRWMQSRALSEEQFWRFVNDSLLVAKLERLFETEIDDELIDHLQVTAETVS